MQKNNIFLEKSIM